MILIVSFVFITSLARVVDMSLGDLVYAIKSTGACTDADEAKMNAAGGGDGDNNFPGMCAECGEVSWNVFTGFEEDKFSECLVGKISISDACAMCFAAAGKYGFDNCKKACFSTTWCSESCLSCSLYPYQDNLDQCTGLNKSTIPQPIVC